MGVDIVYLTKLLDWLLEIEEIRGGACYRFTETPFGVCEVVLTEDF